MRGTGSCVRNFSDEVRIVLWEGKVRTSPVGTVTGKGGVSGPVVVRSRPWSPLSSVRPLTSDGSRLSPVSGP